MKLLPPRSRLFRRCLSGLCVAALAAGAHAETAAKLTPGDLVAICGDSITEQKLYSAYMETYLLACQAGSGVQAAQFGWGGETAGGFQGRVNNDVLVFRPSVATLCYGMNDGGYIPTDAKKLAQFKTDLEASVEKLKAAGVRSVLVGSPGAVDSTTFKSFWGTPPDAYNQTLADFGTGAREVAGKANVNFVDLHGLMIEVMAKAKAKYGRDYVLAGKDGIHPNENGHLVMAYAFLKGLGCEGNVGELKFDLAGGTATASAGHKVLEATRGGFKVESSRYPFCFKGDPAKPDATAGVVEFFPFNQDLNRFILKVSNATTPRVKVTWGDASKEFDAAELAKGINLAAEFAENNPFSKPFAQVQEAVLRQQRYETPMMKEMLHNLSDWRKGTPGQDATFDTLQNSMIQTDVTLRKVAAEAVKPVQLEIKVEAVP